MKHKLREWSARYLPAEILGTITAVVSALVGHMLTGNLVVSAFAGTVGENIGYYGTIVFMNRKNHSNFFAQLWHTLLEFGPAELLDSLLLRPFWMWYLPSLVGNFSLGIILGKLAADVTFYIPTILSYELKKKWLK